MERFRSNWIQCEDLNRRRWCRQYADGRWMIILPNYRFVVSYEEIRDLTLILDDLNSEYKRVLKKMAKTLEVEKFEYQNIEEVKILELDKRCWNEIYNFMREHTCDREVSEWNIFSVNLRHNRIEIIRNDYDLHYRDGVSEGIHAQLVVKEKKYCSDMIEIYWKPGFTVSADDEML